MEISNNYSTAKVWNTSNKNVSKSSEKSKWKLTDSLKEKIVDLAKKDAQDNVYMGKAFMNLRKTEDRKSTRLNSSHITRSRMPSSA